MQKNTLLIGAGIIVILLGILFFVRAPQTQAPASVTPFLEANHAPVAETPTPANPQSASGEAVIIETDAGFSPDTITVKKGTTVTFKNQSSDKTWPASNPHPIHTEYPTKGGCIASTFDACKGIPPGGSWSFTFTIPGQWAYHDHRNPLREGTIIVQ